MNVSGNWAKILSPEFDKVNQWNLVEEIQQAARNSSAPCTVSFGTSGWRGELGSEFTLRNVQIVAKAIVRVYQDADAELKKHLGSNSFEEVQNRGIVLAHDNRMLGSDFARIVAGVLNDNGIKVYYGGEATTPEVSAAVVMLKAAGGINITPSHNPADFSGLKFNPADGGPAGPEITSLITQYGNELMADHQYKEPGTLSWEEVNLSEIYRNFIIQQGTIDLDAVLSFIDSGDITLVTDHVHGATRGLPKFLLNDSEYVIPHRTEDDVLFGGVAPEPSSKNLEVAKTIINSKNTKFRVAVIFDPDGDRIRWYDANNDLEISMNSFGAMALHYFAVHKKQSGVVAKSVATSNFVNTIAAKLGVEVVETPVGFKNFRPNLLPDTDKKALVAFEESDGISGLNNTVEKDAQFGLLLSLEMMAKTGKSLGDYLKELKVEYGEFFPERFGFAVDKELVGKPLVEKVNRIAGKAPVGSVIKIGSAEKKVNSILTLDGVKIIFEDESWMLIRPSGTEPKVRIYAECRREDEKEPMFESAKELFFN